MVIKRDKHFFAIMNSDSWASLVRDNATNVSFKKSYTVAFQ